MRRIKKIFIFIIPACLLISGCAATGNKLAYDRQSGKYELFDNVNDGKALETFILIYNVKPRTMEIEVARNLSLEEFTDVLKKRKSRAINESGIFDLEYTPVDLKKWSDAQVLEFYDYLDTNIKNININVIEGSTDDEKALRIIFMAARDAVAGEGRRRDGLRKLWTVFGHVVNIALTVAVSAI